MSIVLEKKKTAKYTENLSVKVPEDVKQMYAEMSYARYEVTDPVRDAVAHVIVELYRQFKDAATCNDH